MAIRHAAPTVERSPEEAVPELGLRRVRWVRLQVSDSGVRAEVVGIAHRFPVRRRVPLRWANRLIRAGYPYVVHRAPEDG